jgi:hypothetical protein
MAAFQRAENGQIEGKRHVFGVFYALPRKPIKPLAGFNQRLFDYGLIKD